IDAYISPSESDEVFAPGSVITRLFPNSREEEQAYFRRTQIFPIMHTFVLRDSLVEQEPWIVGSLMDAWDEAQKQTARWVRDQRKSELVWAGDYYLQERAFFGDWDPWKNGFQHNRQTLDALCQYAYEQHLVETRLNPDDIWITNR